jgi:hypothetical protein
VRVGVQCGGPPRYDAIASTLRHSSDRWFPGRCQYARFHTITKMVQRGRG